MTTFDERRDAQENKWANNEESRFRTIGRRNRLLAAWAAGTLGKSASDVEAYTQAVIRADFEETGDDDVIRKLKADFDAAGIASSDTEIKAALARCMVEAQAKA